MNMLFSRLAGGFLARRARVLTVCSTFALALPALADDSVLAWSSNLKNLSAKDGRTLFAIAHDLFPGQSFSDARYTACIDAFDDAAADPAEKAAAEEAMSLVVGAARRMGYHSYEDIADEQERLRMARMLAEGRWMRRFKKGMEECLNAQPQAQ